MTYDDYVAQKQNKINMRKLIYIFIALLVLCACKPSLSFQTAVQKADLCYMAQDYRQANNYYKQAFKAADAAPQSKHYANAASVAALAGDHQTAFKRLHQLIANNREWYASNFATNPDYLPLHEYPEWQVLQDTVEARQERIEKDYDHELVKRLQMIFQRDQEPRQAFFYAYQTEPDNQALIDSLIRKMQEADAINLIEIKDILNTYGFPSKSKVGTNNAAIWAVIQHSEVAYQKECYPMLYAAAEQNELSWENVAMLADRIAMWEGRPQQYGSQVVKDSVGNNVIYKLLNKDSVDYWRAEVGMSPLSEYAAKMNAIIP